MPEHKVFLHAGTAQIQVAVLKAQVFTGLAAVLDDKGRRLGGVQKLPLMDNHLNLACLEIGIGHALGTQAHAALDGNDIFQAQDNGALVGLRGNVGRKDNLGQAHAVAQVNKDEAAVVAAELDPAHKADVLVHILGCQLAAAGSTLPVAKVSYVSGMLLLEILYRFSHKS